MSYSKIHQDSLDTVDSGLDLFRAPVTKTSILEGNVVVIGPTRNPDGSQIDFEYQTGGNEYLDACNSFLHVQCQVTTTANTNIEGVDELKIMPVTNFIHNLFAIVQLSYGGFDISHESLYPYVAYMENLLSFDTNYKKTIGQTSLWIQDESGVLNTADINADNTNDVKKRKALIAGSKTIDMIGKINLGFVAQDRYLIPNSTIKLRLTRSDPAFCLVKTEAHEGSYKIKINKCDLMLHQVKVHPSIASAHNSHHSRGNTVKYPLIKTDAQMFTIPGGVTSQRINVMINQQKPKRLFFALVDHKAKNGDYTYDPFKFHHFNLSSIVLEVDGHPTPSKPIQMDYANGAYTLPYFNLARVTGKAFSDQDHAITLEKFAKGYAIYAFDLTPDHSQGGGVNLIKNSSIVLDLTFKRQLDSTISVFMYSERDDLIEIDWQRSVHRLSTI